MCAYIPSYSNPFPTYQPAMRVIAAITQNTYNPTVPTLVTTTVNHQYIVGTIVRFDIPLLFGMQGLNQQVGTILSVPTPTTFTTDVITAGMDPFTLPSTFPPAYQDAMVVPIGEINDILTAATNNVLPYK
jgi:hypothetical protein